MSTRLIVVIDYFPICTNIKSLYYIPETNVSYISIKKKKTKQKKSAFREGGLNRRKGGGLYCKVRFQKEIPG